ncbi:hypothetical protein EMIT0P74_60230 [Pseudomonas sp. IT-P74]
MLGLLSKLIRESGRLRGNDPQRALCHPTILREASSSGAQIQNREKIWLILRAVCSQVQVSA